jgi:ABC-type sugar transport system substrate-binding protein
MVGVIAKGEKIDGIINDGGNMGIGIVDAYKDAGLPLPPLCGDTGNGWLRVAKEGKIKFMGTYPGGNELTLDAVDTAVQVLKGIPVAKNVLPVNTVFSEANVDELYRPDLNDQYGARNTGTPQNQTRSQHWNQFLACVLSQNLSQASWRWIM